MKANVYAHCATVFLARSFEHIDTNKLSNDYGKYYHGKRPEQPITTDSFHFIVAQRTQENIDELNKVNDLIKRPHLRSVNFVLLDDPNDDMDDVTKDQLMQFLKDWSKYFQSNAYNGTLVHGIVVQTYEALLIEGYQVRGINRLSLGLGAHK